MFQVWLDFKTGYGFVMKLQALAFPSLSQERNHIEDDPIPVRG